MNYLDPINNRTSDRMGKWATLRTDLAVLLLCVTVSAAMYLPGSLTLRAFLIDDYYIMYHATTEYTPFTVIAGASFHFTSYRPGSMYLLAVLYKCFGTDPAGYYFVLAFLHALAGFLLYRLLRSWKGIQPGMLGVFIILIPVVGLLVHPDLYYDAIWISNITESITLLMFIAGLTALVGYSRKPDPLNASLIILWYTIGIFSKESMAGFPLLVAAFLLLTDRFALKRRRNVVLLASLLLIATIYLFLRYDPAFIAHFDPIWLLKKPATAVSVTLTALYPPLALAIHPFFKAYPLIAIAILLGGLAGIVWLLKTRPYLRKPILGAIIIYGLSLLPRVLNPASTRINSMQVVLLLLGFYLVLRTISTRIAMIAGITIILAYSVTTQFMMDSWYGTVRDDQYKELARDSPVDGPRNCLVLSLAGDQIVFPYIMYFFKTGSFGYDSLATTSGIGFYGETFGSAIDLDSIPKTGDDQSELFTLSNYRDHSFVYRPLLDTEPGLTHSIIDPSAERVDTVRFWFHDTGDSVRYFVCFNERLVQLQH